MKKKSKVDRVGSSKRSASGLTELETDIMLVLWERGESTVAEVREYLVESRVLAHTTIITMLDRMCVKGVVRKVAGESKAKRYRPVLRRELVADRLLSNVRTRFFDGSSASLFAHLLESGEVDEAELARIRSLLDRSDPD
jgi:BlaI family penicillinase repressor